MTAMDFLTRLRNRRIRVWAEGDQLVFRAPQGALTPALRAELAERKPELLSLLHGLASSQGRILPASRGGDSPVSFAQERLWFLDQLEPDSPVYNTHEAFRLSGPLNAEALEESLNEIVRRHEVLRTTFPVVDDRPTQRVHPDLALKLPVVDLQELPESQREAKALQLVEDYVRQPFSLAQGPLVRFLLLRLEGEAHTFVLALHHIISDGWSTDMVLFPELSALYKAYATERPSPLPEPALQYADYTIWQRRWLRGDVLEGQLAYWKQQLDRLPHDLDLPADHPQQPVQTNRGAERSLALSRNLTEALELVSQQAGVTIFMTLLAAFKVLLRRYSGQDDIVVGTPVAGRNRPETEALIGFFVNTLVLRTDLSGDPSFWQLLDRVRQVSLGAYDHQDIPFEKLVETLQPDRAPGRNPLFRVMFQLLAHEPEILALHGLDTSRLNIAYDSAMFDLSLDILQEAGRLRCVVSYRLDLFEHATIERMLGHFQTLLECVVANPRQPISSLSLLTEPEQRMLLVEWNQTQADHAPGLCAHQLFDVQVERTPGAPAVVFGDQALTYRQLELRANQLAHRLLDLGVGPEVLVGICMERSPDVVVAILGVLKAGGAYVPLDPAYPLDRLSFLLQDAGMGLLLTSGGLFKSLPEPSVKLIHLDTEWESIATENGQTPVNRASPDNLAYVIYTSGSTGQPKGIQITHKALVNYTLAACTELGRGPGERLLQVASTSFDSAAHEVFTSLLSGATLVLPPDEIVTSASMILQVCHEQRVTALDPPTAVWHALVDAMDEHDLEFPETIRLVNFGGERALPKRLASWYARVGDRVWLLNGYGPTETTVNSTSYALGNTAELVATGRDVPIGRPISNTQTYILDERLAPVPIGVCGELYIAGMGLARGYLNQPGLTAERFVPCPFSQEPGARMYRTGDLVRFLADGNIEFLGRRDYQVKLRGFRVEPGEIETVLMQHEDVREAAVVPHQDTPGLGGTRLAAYVVSSRELAIGDLRQFLRSRLPDYMVPSFFVMLETLPSTHSGKVDRRALPIPDWSKPEREQAFVLPRTPVEEVLTGLWAEVLSVERVGIHDSFFDLGGHSLLATRLVSRIRSSFGVDLPLRTLFECPTIATLSRTLIANEGQPGQANRIARVLQSLAAMSDDEISQLLGASSRPEGDN